MRKTKVQMLDSARQSLFAAHTIDGGVTTQSTKLKTPTVMRQELQTLKKQLTEFKEFKENQKFLGKR